MLRASADISGISKILFYETLIGSRALTASPKQYRYNVVAHSPLEQPDETPDTLPAR
jgi:hypothetical protein